MKMLERTFSGLSSKRVSRIKISCDTKSTSWHILLKLSMVSFERMKLMHDSGVLSLICRRTVTLERSKRNEDSVQTS